MSDTSQIALIRKLYAAMGDVNAFKSLLADDAVWDIAEGFPNGGVYRGIDTIVSGFFLDLSRFLRQPVKTQNPSNGELSHGIVS